MWTYILYLCPRLETRRWNTICKYIKIMPSLYLDGKKESKFTYLQITFLRKGCLSCFTLCTFSYSGQRFARNVYANGYMSLFHLNWIKYLNKYLAFSSEIFLFFSPNKLMVDMLNMYSRHIYDDNCTKIVYCKHSFSYEKEMLTHPLTNMVRSLRRSKSRIEIGILLIDLCAYVLCILFDHLQ